MKDMTMNNEQIFAEIEVCITNLHKSFTKLGETLAVIKGKKSHKEKGFNNFKDYVEKALNMPVSLANRLIRMYELYVEELDIDEQTLNEIGYDRLFVIKPVIDNKTVSQESIEDWIETAKTKALDELKEEVSKEKAKNKKGKSFKDIFAEQNVTGLCTFFNCSTKELAFKMAIYFHERDLNQVKEEINTKLQKLSETGQLDNMVLNAINGGAE